MSKSLNSRISNLEDLSNQVREISYSLKAVGHLFSNTNPEAPPNSDELEGIGCLFKNIGERAYQIAWQIDEHWIAQVKK